MRPLLPESVYNRQDKMGFPVPLTQWVRGPAGEFVRDILRRQKAQQEAAAVRDAILDGCCNTCTREYFVGPRHEPDAVRIENHGESFGEHGSLGHGYRLTDEELRVPFFIVFGSSENSTPWLFSFLKVSSTLSTKKAR